MKFFIAIFAGLCFTVQAKSQTQTVDSLYIVTYTTGTAWDKTKKPNEQIHFKEHGANLSALRKNGTIKFGARYADKGIIIITAASFQTARELINADQAVVNKLFNADIQKLNPFYEGCVERPKADN
jgi:hypothetical protein